jgi:uncharacterized membrane protein
MVVFKNTKIGASHLVCDGPTSTYMQLPKVSALCAIFNSAAAFTGLNTVSAKIYTTGSVLSLRVPSRGSTCLAHSCDHPAFDYQQRAYCARQRCAATALQMSLIGNPDMWGNYAVIAGAAAAGIKLERTPVGRSLSGAVCSMLLTAILCNIGVLPAVGSPHVRELQLFAVKLATPLLLLGADLNKVLAETGSLLRAFLLAAVATTLGATLATVLLAMQLRTVGGQAWCVLSALTAKNIGGGEQSVVFVKQLRRKHRYWLLQTSLFCATAKTGLNFVATAELLQVPAAMCATALAVDNLLGLMYFPLVGWLGRNEAAEPEPAVDTTSTATAAATAASESSSAVTDEVERSSVAMATGLAVAAVSEALARRYMAGGGPLIATGITVTLATLFPKRMQVCVCTNMYYHSTLIVSELSYALCMSSRANQSLLDTLAVHNLALRAPLSKL